MVRCCGEIAAAVLIVASGAAGCRSAAPPADTRAVVPRDAASVILVRNHHGADLRIWVVGEDGKNHRLGIAPRLGSTMLALPRAISLPARLTLVAIPLSHHEPHMYGPVEVDAGARLLFTVAGDGSLSTLTRLP